LCEQSGEEFGRVVNDLKKFFFLHTIFTVIHELFTKCLFCAI